METDEDEEAAKNEEDDKMNSHNLSSSLNDSTSYPPGSQPQDSQASNTNDCGDVKPDVEDTIDLDNEAAPEIPESQASGEPMDSSIDEQAANDDNCSETSKDNKQNDEAPSEMDVDTESKAENLDEDVDNRAVSNSQSDSNSKPNSVQDQPMKETPLVQSARKDQANAVPSGNSSGKSDATKNSTAEAQVNGSERAVSEISSRIMKDANGSAKLKSALFER